MELQQTAIIEYKNPKDIKPHPLNLEIYGEDGYQDLIESIRELGVLQAIYAKKDGTIISGHRRWRAAIEAGCTSVPVITARYASKLDEETAIIEHNRYRIKNGEQLWREGKKLEDIEAEKAKNRLGGRHKSTVEIFPQLEGKTRDIVAQKIGLGSGKQWDKLDFIAQNAPARLKEINPEGVSLSKAFKLTQREVISKPTIEPQAPEGQFSVIVIDPPWPYQTTCRDYDPEGRVIAPPYEAMPIEDIMAIQLPMADDCIVWLWTTNAFMHEAYHCLEAWGLEPKVVLTWFKGRGPDDHIQRGVGHWLRGQTEHCIMAIKGKPKLVPYESAGTAFFAINRGHSTKPDEFYQIVDMICLGRKLDWFGRKKRDGWEIYGDQAT